MKPALTQPSSEVIQNRAFEIYQERQAKGLPGDEKSDWEKALQEFQQDGQAVLIPHKVSKKKTGKSLLSRLLLWGLMGCGVLVGAFLLYSGRAVKKPDNKPRQQYVVDLVVGKVLTSHNDDSTNWLEADPGMLLDEKDLLQTGKEAYCDIIMPGRGIIRISEESELVLAQLQAGKEQLRLNKGKIGLNISQKLKKDETFKVETDVAVASVRGTQFFVEKNENGINTVLLEGIVKLHRKLEFTATPDVRKMIDQELEITLTSNQFFSVSPAENKRISGVLTMKLQDKKSLASIREYTAQIKQEDKKNTLVLEKPEQYQKEMRQINTPEKLKKTRVVQQRYYIYYVTRETAISSENQAALSRIIELSKQNPDLHIEIRGHTDNEGDPDENRELSLKRAQVVLEYLVSQGIPRENMTALGLGERLPLADNNTESGKALNRRTELIIH